jgi:hypothetical protein
MKYIIGIPSKSVGLFPFVKAPHDQQIRSVTTQPANVPYRVTCTYKGNGRQVTVLAESSSEARRLVMDMFSGAVVTGAGKKR